MPDENKFAKLREIGYSIQPCCGRCAFADLDYCEVWGTCGKHKYQHLKHTGEKRKVSIHMFGWCKDFAVNPENPYLFGAHAEFLPAEEKE